MHYLYRMALLFLVFILNSCFPRLSVQTNYLTEERLASYFVGSPDPNLNRSIIGQRLIISWFLSDDEINAEDLHLKLSVRLYNQKEMIINEPIEDPRSYFIYQLSDHLYCESNGGILTYKVEIIGNGCVMETWEHPLWVPLIKLNN